MRRSVSKTRTLCRTAAGLGMSLLAGATLLVFAAPAASAQVGPVTTAIPGPGLVASCPPSTNSISQSAETVSGVTLTNLNGSCTLTQAHAAVGLAQFGANSVFSARADCTVNGVPTSSAVYNGATITAFETIHTADGYTLIFNVPVTTPNGNGRIAVEIITPTGAVVDVAEVLCAGAAYPLSAQLNTQQAPALSPVSTTGHGGGGSSTALLLLGGAIVAFVIVNVTAVRRFRHRHNGMTG